MQLAWGGGVLTMLLIMFGEDMMSILSVMLLESVCLTQVFL